jgi:hypothetical protein
MEILNLHQYHRKVPLSNLDFKLDNNNESVLYLNKSIKAYNDLQK